MDWNNFIYTPKPNKKLANSKDERILTTYQLYIYNALLYIREIYAERIQSPSHYLISKDILYDIVKNTPYTPTYTMITTNSSNNKYNNSSSGNSITITTNKKYNSNSIKYKLNLHLMKGLHPIFKQPPDSQIHIDFNHIYTTAIQEATDLNLPNRHIPPSEVSGTGSGIACEDISVEEGLKKYINIRQRIAEVYGEHTANHILPMHMIKKLAGDERCLDEVSFPYRRELIRKVEAELRSSPGEVRSGPGEVRSAGNIL